MQEVLIQYHQRLHHQAVHHPAQLVHPHQAAHPQAHQAAATLIKNFVMKLASQHQLVVIIQMTAQVEKYAVV